jgi:hypothetical protein
MNQRKIMIIFLISNVLTFLSCNENESIDPRDPFCGSYRCKVIYENHLDPGHALYKPDTIYYSTLIVSKHESSSILQISGEIYVKVELNFTDFTFKGADFEGQRLGGRFFDNDSIYLTGWMTPVGLIRTTYRGKRIN